MGMLKDLFRGGRPAETAELTLYRSIIAKGREPHWYVEGGVHDTIDGRFGVITAILCMVLLRFEARQEGKKESARLTEIFVEDMDGQLREIGIGDMIVGKHVGRMMGALGGRLGAYRAALAGSDDAVSDDMNGDKLREAVSRNLYDEPPADAALDHSTLALSALYAHLNALDFADIMTGNI